MSRLALRSLRKSYDGREVVHGVDLDIDAGEFVVIVGPSGCGKSTLLRMIAGLEEATQGDIVLNGEQVNDIDPADRGCAMVFQNYALYPHMTARENIGYPLRLSGVKRDERARRVDEAAAILGLSDLLDRRPAQLSGGQRQRVAMGRAIVREPALFLFDEPLSNLDATLRVQMRIEIRRLHNRLDATSIFVTHDQIEAMTLADRLVVMNAGRIEQIGTPAEVYRKPASAFVAGFLGAPVMNLAEASVIAPGLAALDAAPGSAIETPGLDLPIGGKFQLGIRPEDVVLAGEGLDGRIELIEELGGSRIAYCHAAARDFAVVLPRDGSETVGSPARLAFPAHALHYFDRQSGMRL
jgi:sn-glycerol 3-phosphate transport system ATP-binding protein